MIKNNELKRNISGINLLFISFAAIFGSGWLFAPLYAAQIAGAHSLLAWALGAFISCIIGIAMAEVVSLFPRSGGLTYVALIGHGASLSLLITVFNLLVFILLPVIEVRAILLYCSGHFSILKTLPWIGNSLALLLLFLITLVNLFGNKISSTFNNVLVFLKVITPILVILFFFGKTEPLPVSSFSFFPIPWEQVFKAIATSGIIFSFNGFNQATIFAGEAKDPKRAIPFAILGSILFSGLLYILLQYVFLRALGSETKLEFLADQGPFMVLALGLGLTWIAKLIFVDAIISPLGTAFTYASAAPRLFYVLADYGFFWQKVKNLNKYGVPFLAIIITLLVEVFVFFLLPSLKVLLTLLVASFVLCYTVAPAGLLRLRQTHPHLQRLFQVPGKKMGAFLFCYCSLYFSNLMVFSCGWEALRNLSILTLIILFFKKITSPKIEFSFKGIRWFSLQLLGLTLVSYFENEKIFSFSFCVMLVAILSLLSLYSSQKDFDLI